MLDLYKFLMHLPDTVVILSPELKEPELQKLIGLHQDFKKLALLSHYESGRIEQEHAGMAAVHELSENFLHVLTQLKTKITIN